MIDDSDVYVPARFRGKDGDEVSKIWRIVPEDGIFLSALKMKVGKRAQEILTDLVAAWDDHNVIKTRNPANPFITKRPKADWEQIICPRCKKSFRSRANFQEHWNEESRAFSKVEKEKYLAKMRD